MQFLYTHVIMMLLAVLLCGAAASAQQEVVNPSFKEVIEPFFASHCVRCHGEKKQKGDVSLHDFAGGPASGNAVARWALVLDVLRSGEMPPEDEPQPDAANREQVQDWIDRELRQRVTADEAMDDAPTMRRLTNAEYHNTMRDLLGVELQLTDNLPEDPTRPYLSLIHI